MSKKSIQTTDFINDFEDVSKIITSNDKPTWLRELKTQGLNRFKEIGIPTVKDEEWKYTNLKAITDQKFNIPSKSELTQLNELTLYCDQYPIDLIFINGYYSPKHSNTDKLPDGVTISSIKEALESDSEAVQQMLKRYASNQSTAFVALNNALLEDGSFIKIDKNTQIKDVIHIVHLTNYANGQTLTTPRSMIYLDQSAEATILESHIAFDDSIVYLSNSLTDIELGKNATLHYCKAQKESLKAYHIGNTRVWQEADSNLLSISITAGAALTRNDINIVLDGEGINTTLDGLYSVYGNQHVDNHTSVDHRYPHCTSNQLYKGILNGASRAVFNGKIFVQPAAQQTNSYQLNKNLLLGEDCRVDTKPQLEIFADDVKCTHGATVGQLDKNELFYLQTRNIGKSQARKMLARGFVDDLLDTIKNQAIVDKLHILLEPSFAQFS